MDEYKNIHSPDLASQMWDWSPFNDCFHPTKIRIGDGDGIVERNGYFLFIETKRPNVDVSLGQMILLEALAKHHNWTVILVWGEINKPEKLQYIGKSEKHDIDLDGMKKHIRDWFLKVDKMKNYHDISLTHRQGFAWLKSLSLPRLIIAFKWLRSRIEDEAQKIVDIEDKAA